MYTDRDFDREQPLPWNAMDLAQDLELNHLFAAMSGEDKFLYEIARRAVFSSVSDVATIRYRQAILADCLATPNALLQMYAIAVEAEEGKRGYYWVTSGRYPSSTLMNAVGLLEFCVGILRKLRKTTDAYQDVFRSSGLQTLCATLKDELSDEYFDIVEAHLKRLKFRGGALVSARLGAGNKGVDYVLRRPNHPDRNWFERLFCGGPDAYSYQLHPRDEAGARVLSNLRDRGLNLVANAAAQAADHILSFLKLLRAELGFYVACLNLHTKLTEKREPVCFPDVSECGARRHWFTGLYDVSLALTISDRVVGNDVDADGSEVVVVTGANRGGKSVFLRSIGLAQLMTQCGMFVGAEAFAANTCTGLYTHYKREEDASMKHGKFAEEISRMSEIAGYLNPNALMLFNESFAATNDREGSEIARQIVAALLEKRVKVFYVTHLYEFARGLWEEKSHKATFLRAERQPDGTRTYKLAVGEPLETSYGEDLYNEIFSDAETQNV
jgi:hypothetical protein